MKTLKFLIAGFSVLIGIGVVGTGVTLGELYSTNQTVYEASENADLNVNALENLYIESDVPVRIIPTEGKPRVEFEAQGNGLMIPEPKYELKVTSEGKSSYINLEETQASQFHIFTNNFNMKLVIYLPEKDINTLKVQANQGSYYYGDKSFAYTSNANIKELILEVGSIDLDLNGGYNKINIDAQNGSIDIASNQAAIVDIDGGSDIKLSGQLQEITMRDMYRSGGNKLLINSALEANINLNNHYGDTIIEGKVKSIKMDGQGGSLTVNSMNPYDVFVKSHDYMDVSLKGMINTATVEGYNGEVRLYPTGMPKRIEVLGEQVKVHAVLPENISGFEIKKSTQGYSDDYNNNFYVDFDVKSENINDQLRRIYFGDEAMKMFIGAGYGEVYITK